MRTRNRILSMLAAAGLVICVMSTTVFATDSGGCSHEWEWKSDNDVHWHECSICGKKTPGVPHRWDHGIIYVATSCTDGGKKVFTCEECGKTKIEPYEAPGHRWGTTWASDATHHWHECENSNCPVTDNSGKDGYAEHTGGRPPVQIGHSARLAAWSTARQTLPTTPARPGRIGTQITALIGKSITAAKLTFRQPPTPATATQPAVRKAGAGIAACPTMETTPTVPSRLMKISTGRNASIAITYRTRVPIISQSI